MKGINSQFYGLAFAEGGSKTHTFFVTRFIFLVCRRGPGVQSAHTLFPLVRGPLLSSPRPPSLLMGLGWEAAAARPLVTDDT